jgi:hypothetical protein
MAQLARAVFRVLKVRRAMTVHKVNKVLSGLQVQRDQQVALPVHKV